MASPIRVAVTGAAGQIGYALIFRLASGQVFGPQQPVILHLIEVPPVMPSLDGVMMELDDCAFPTLAGVVKADSSHLEDGFRDCNFVLCVGSVPRKEGMERGDLIRVNGPIFTSTGKAIEAAAASDVRVVVIGNPCNTNCLIAMRNAPKVPRERWFAMTRLDQNRAATQLARKAGVPVEQVKNLGIWGNHSATQFPDLLPRDHRRPSRHRSHSRRGLAQRPVYRNRAKARRGRDQGPRRIERRVRSERRDRHCQKHRHADRLRRLHQRRRVQ